MTKLKEFLTIIIIHSFYNFVDIFIGIRANFSKGAEQSLPEKNFDSAQKKLLT